MESCASSTAALQLAVSDLSSGAVLLTFVLTSLFSCFHVEKGLEMDEACGALYVSLNVTSLSPGVSYTESEQQTVFNLNRTSYLFDNLKAGESYRFCLHVNEPPCMHGCMQGSCMQPDFYYPLATVCKDHTPSSTSSWSGQLAQFANSLNPFQASNASFLVSSNTSEDSSVFSFFNPFQTSSASFSVSFNTSEGSSMFSNLNPFQTSDQSEELERQVEELQRRLDRVPSVWRVVELERRLDLLQERLEKTAVTSFFCGYQKEHSQADSLIVYSHHLVDGGLGGLRPGEGVWRSGVYGLYSINYSMYNSVGPGEENQIFLYRNGRKMRESEHHSFYDGGGRAHVYDMGGRSLVLGLDHGDTLELRSATHEGHSLRITFCVTLLRALEL